MQASLARAEPGGHARKLCLDDGCTVRFSNGALAAKKWKCGEREK
jgi:hypothetical protein